MGIKKLRNGETKRIQTEAGLDMRVFNASLEVELERMPFGVEIKLVDRKDLDGVLSPHGAYYIIKFYESKIVTGESGGETEIKTMKPGAVYLSSEGVIISGCKPDPSSGTGKGAIINYRED